MSVKGFANGMRYWRLWRERKRWSKRYGHNLPPPPPRTDLVDVKIDFEYDKTWETRYCAGYSYLSGKVKKVSLYQRYDEWMCERKEWKLHTKESDSHYAEECGVRLIDE